MQITSYSVYADPVIVSIGDRMPLWHKYLNSVSNFTQSGQIVMEPTEYVGETFDAPVYYGVTPGFDALDMSTYWGTELRPILVSNADGTLPEKSAPVANPDTVEVHGTATAELDANVLLANDHEDALNLAKSLWVESLNPSFWAEFTSGDGQGQLVDIQNVSGSSFLGAIQLRYQVTDVFNEVSDWATVTVDWLGSASDRSDINGTDDGEIIDFSLSNQSVGLHGLGGNDLLRGSQAGDTIYGDDGDDRIGGRNGDDLIDGGNGGDSLFGDAGNDTIDGGAGNDTISGGEGNDLLRGGSGNDQVHGDSGDDLLGGKAGDDILHGGTGNDTIWGNDGQDDLHGDAGNDSMNGGAGDDQLNGGLGMDRLRGEGGADNFVFVHGEAQGDTILDFEGAGVAGGDTIAFQGYGADAVVHQVEGDVWQIDAGGISETFRIAGVTNLGQGDWYFA